MDCVCTGICVPAQMWICVFKYVSLKICESLSVCTNIHICIHVCVCIHVYHICFTMLSNMSIHPHVCMSMSSSARTRGAQGFVLYVICTSHMYDFVCLQVSLQSRPHASNHAYREHGRIHRPRPTARGSASGKRGCGQQEMQQRFLGSFPK